MAIYRSIQMTFWTDPKVSDDFTPEDKYFYLYLFTNPHTNLCGCYEVGKKQVSWETGYSIDTIERLLDRFEKIHRVIRFSEETKEVLLINWHKYNWTESEKFRKPLLKEIESIKCPEFREYLGKIFEGEDTVSIGYQYPMDTTVTVTDTVTVSDTVSVSNKNTKNINYKDMVNNTELSEPLKNTLCEWIDYKKEIKKPYKSERGFKQFINRVAGYTLDYSDSEIIAVINKSMASNYQGVVWDWLGKNQQQTKSSSYVDAINNRLSVVDEWLMEGNDG